MTDDRGKCRAVANGVKKVVTIIGAHGREGGISTDCRHESLSFARVFKPSV